MLNTFAIESQAAYRRWEWEREIAAAEQHALARPKNGRKRWSQLALPTLAYLRSLATPGMPVLSRNSAAAEGGATVA
jgi:hypothetical protein